MAIAFDVMMPSPPPVVRRMTLRQFPFVVIPARQPQLCTCDGCGDASCDLRDCVVTVDAELLCRACVAALFVQEGEQG